MNEEKESREQNDQAQCIKHDVNEMNNQDFVNRLLAATPPYLYSTFSNNYYFSDVLRSIVQNRNNENMRNIQFQQQIARRSRKRHLSNFHLKSVNENTEANKFIQEDKPLELTNKLSSENFQNINFNNKNTQNSDIVNISEDQAKCKSDFRDQPNIDSRSEHSDLALSSTNPVWYSSLYPSYGIDPLHFFIDLRVSGHIYDNKKNSPDKSEDTDTQYDTSAINKKSGSAFSVPTPRHDHNFSNKNLIISPSKTVLPVSNSFSLEDSKENMINKSLNSSNENFIFDKNMENSIDVEILDNVKFKK